MPPSYLCKPDRFLSLLSLLINHVDNGSIICKDKNLTTKLFCVICVLATLSATLVIILNCISLVVFKATLSGLQKIQMIARRSSFCASHCCHLIVIWISAAKIWQKERAEPPNNDCQGKRWQPGGVKDRKHKIYHISCCQPQIIWIFAD